MKLKPLLFYILVLIVFPLSSYSQPSAIDSLLHAVENAPEDTSKALTLIDLCFAYRRELNDMKNVSQYNTILLNLSKKINYKKGRPMPT